MSCFFYFFYIYSTWFWYILFVFLLLFYFLFVFFFFFFKQKTAYEMRISDWSSDVCSSDLITSVVVSFDGYGDSGQIEGIEARNADGEVALPQIDVEIAVARYDEDDFERCCQPLERAIEELARSEEHTSELQSLMRISYAVFCLKKKTNLQVQSQHKSID